MTKSLSFRSRPWQARRTSRASPADPYRWPRVPCSARMRRWSAAGRGREGLGAPKRIPHRPAECRIGDAGDRPLEEHVLEVRLVADGVGAPQHVEPGLALHPVEGGRREHVAEGGDEPVRVLARGHDPDAARIVGVEIERPGNPAPLERGRGGARVTAAPEGGELHEQAAVEGDPLSVPRALLGEVGCGGLDRRGSFFAVAHASLDQGVGVVPAWAGIDDLTNGQTVPSLRPYRSGVGSGLRLTRPAKRTTVARRSD